VSEFQVQDPAYEARVRETFAQQQLMQQLQATITDLTPGRFQITMPFAQKWTQHNNFLHAGIVTAIVDSACGFAAYTLMPADVDVLTVEYKVNFMSPGIGERFIATGQVLKAGRTITVCEGKVVAKQGDSQKLIAAMQATMIAVRS
jgi:uncharacterized protein (TIGR00369 family)